MKIRMIEPGYASYTGHYGSTEFKDGVSVGEMSDSDVRLISAIMSVECVDDGKDPGENAKFQASLQVSAFSTNLPTKAELQAAGKIAPDAPEDEVNNAPALTVSTAYTAEQLEEIADKGGIAGLREIAEPLGLKGTSITGLIASILGAQAGPASIADADADADASLVGIPVEKDAE